MVRKLIILLLMEFLVPVTLPAQKAIIIHMKDGSTNVVALNDAQVSQSPTLTFEGSDLVVKSSQTIRLNIRDIQRYTFGDYSTGLSEIKGRDPGIVFNGDDITISNQRPGIRGELYNAGGQLVRRQNVGGSGSQLSLSGLPSGVYILKIGSTTYKILKP